jgi:TPR repeat protein
MISGSHRAIGLASLALACACQHPSTVVESPPRSDSAAPAARPSLFESDQRVAVAACRNKPAECTAAASAHWTEESWLAERPRLIASYEAACDVGSGEACAYFAEQYVAGNYVPRDLHRGAALYERACLKLGWAKACEDGGALYTRRITEGAFHEDLPRAAALFAKGCELDNPYSCAFLGGMYKAGRGVKADPTKAEQLDARARSLGYVRVY